MTQSSAPSDSEERRGNPVPASSGPGETGWTREVLEKIRARDREALGRFFDRYFDRIFSLVYRLVGNLEVAEDVTQEVFLKIYRGAHHLDPTRDPEPWVTTVTYNTCRDYFRSGLHKYYQTAKSMQANMDAAVSVPGEQGNPEQKAMLKESGEKVPAGPDAAFRNFPGGGGSV